MRGMSASVRWARSLSVVVASIPACRERMVIVGEEEDEAPDAGARWG